MYNFIRAIIKNDLELHSQILLFLLVLVIKVRALCVAKTDIITESRLWPHLKIITNGMCDLNILRGSGSLIFVRSWVSNLSTREQEREEGREEEKEEMLAANALE